LSFFSVGRQFFWGGGGGATGGRRGHRRRRRRWAAARSQKYNTHARNKTNTGIIHDFVKSRTALKKDQQEELDCAKKVRAWCVGEAEGGAVADGGAAGDGEAGTPAGGRDVRLGEWTAREIEVLNGWQLLTAKPVVYLVNVSEKDYARKKNKFLPKIFEWVKVRALVSVFVLFCFSFLVVFPLVRLFGRARALKKDGEI